MRTTHAELTFDIEYANAVPGGVRFAFLCVIKLRSLWDKKMQIKHQKYVTTKRANYLLRQCKYKVNLRKIKKLSNFNTQFPTSFPNNF